MRGIPKKKKKNYAKEKKIYAKEKPKTKFVVL